MMADVEIGTLYELNKQVMAQLPPQKEEELQNNYNTIGAWFGKDKNRWFMLMCKERSDFTFLHITDNQFTKAIFELKELLKERGEVLAINYVHGEDAFEIWIKNVKENQIYLFMLFDAEWMIVEV